MDNYVLGLYSIISTSSEVYGTSSPKLSDAFSDILKCGDWDQYGTSFNKALFQSSAFNSTSAGAFECWASHYDRIRRENEFLRDAPAYKDKFGAALLEYAQGTGEWDPVVEAAVDNWAVEKQNIQEDGAE